MNSQKAKNAVIFYGSEGLGVNGTLHWLRLAPTFEGNNHIGSANNGLIGVWQRANDQGAWEVGFRPVPDWKRL
jgi:hypothetical protein